MRAYNDWTIEQWCAPSGGRLVPMIILPLWDAELAAEEVRRNAAEGCRAVTFSENPAELGLPSVHDQDRYWDPFFAACEETGTVINMHLGSSSNLHTTSWDAPMALKAINMFSGCLFAMVDWLTCGAFVRFPTLKIALSEGQIGWIPYVLQRADIVWREHRAFGELAETVPVPPSELFADHVYGCCFDDRVGLSHLDEVGEDNVTWEVDYPHSDSTWPNSRKIAEDQLQHLTDEQVHKVVRGNAIKLYQLDFAD